MGKGACHLEAAAASDSGDDLVEDPLDCGGCWGECGEKACADGVYGAAGYGPGEVVAPATHCMISVFTLSLKNGLTNLRFLRTRQRTCC
jgi:hypothetical protein